MKIEGIDNNAIAMKAMASNQASSGTRISVEAKPQATFTDDSMDAGQNVKPVQEVSPEKVKSAVEDLNKKIKQTNTNCQFSYHEDTHRISITVTDAETGDIIREIPPEKTLDMIAKAWELAGLMVDEKR